MVRYSVIINSHDRSRHSMSECDVTRRIHLGEIQSLRISTQVTMVSRNYTK